jgi:hypothetical protein
LVINDVFIYYFIIDLSPAYVRLQFFGCTDKSKICFDHHKGLFGLLAMLKSIADVYHEGTMETFRSIKVFFIHAAGKLYISLFYLVPFTHLCNVLEETLYLWSLRFEPGGPVYELWLEDMLLIRPDIEDKLEAMPAIINFFWNFKANITCTLIVCFSLTFFLDSVC